MGNAQSGEQSQQQSRRDGKRSGQGGQVDVAVDVPRVRPFSQYHDVQDNLRTHNDKLRTEVRRLKAQLATCRYREGSLREQLEFKDDEAEYWRQLYYEAFKVTSGSSKGRLVGSVSSDCSPIDAGDGTASRFESGNRPNIAQLFGHKKHNTSCLGHALRRSAMGLSPEPREKKQPPKLQTPPMPPPVTGKRKRNSRSASAPRPPTKKLKLSTATSEPAGELNKTPEHMTRSQAAKCGYRVPDVWKDDSEK